MSEKRFTYENNKVYDNLTGEFHSSNMVSVNVLNELADENEQLKKELKKITEILENGGVLLTEKQLLSICENKEIWNVDPVTDTVSKG